MNRETKMAASEPAPGASELMAVFEAYKQANDERLAEIEAKGSADTLIIEKLAKLDRRIDQLSLKAARPDDAAPSQAADGAQDEAWSRYLRSGDESGLARLDVNEPNTAFQLDLEGEVAVGVGKRRELLQRFDRHDLGSWLGLRLQLRPLLDWSSGGLDQTHRRTTAGR